MKAWIIPAACTSGASALQLIDIDRPALKPGEIRIAIKACSTNYRDIVMPMGLYFGGPVATDTIPLSDGAGEIIEIANDVTRFNVGDKVTTNFFQDWITGDFVPSVLGSDLGGPQQGCLAEEIVLDQAGAVHMPKNLSYQEAATLPCAALTAWHTLTAVANLSAGQHVLTLGTGGVSIFALQFAKAKELNVTATSSSDKKIAQLLELGAQQTINYKTIQDWDNKLLELNNGQGADCVVEVGGPGTLQRSMNAVAPGGTIGLIGVLAGIEGEINPLALVAKSIRLQGVYVGSRDMFERMNKFIEEHDIHPIIDSVFAFSDAQQAYSYQASGQHFGKVVISFE